MGANNSTPQESKQGATQPQSNGCPVDHGKSKESGGCPVKHDGGDKGVMYNVYSQPIDPKNQMPLNPNQTPAVGQTKPLETSRVSSSIPKGGADGDTWQYPSPQMFFNALRRKGKGEDVSEDDVETIVAVHNNMNERSWSDLLEWEALHQDTCCSPRLSRFIGRPNDLSPKAWFKSTFLGYPAPFDRHDWTIDRCGKEVRYVIDYYYDEEKSAQDEKPELTDVTSIKSISFDVRPAVDSVEALFDRIRFPILQKFGMEPSVDAMMEKQEAQLASAPPSTSQSSRATGTTPGCPVDHGKNSNTKPSGHSTHNHSKDCGCPVDHGKTAEKSPSDEIVDELAALPTKPTDMSGLTAEEVRKVSMAFQENCQGCFAKIQTCDSEDSCNKASIALNFCMADLVCNFEATKYLKDPQSGENYTEMVDCLERFEQRAREVLGKPESK